jgi:indoleamine 2,3-dioxygenase
LNQVSAGIDRTQLTEGNKIRVDEIGKRAEAQQRFLAREVEKLKERFQNQDKTE